MESTPIKVGDYVINTTRNGCGNALKVRKIGEILAIAVVAIGLVACANAPPEPTVKKLQLEIESQKLELTVGESQIVVPVVVADGSALDDPALEWSSSDSVVATVNNGVITAQGSGDVTITAKCQYGGKEASIAIKVRVKKPTVMLEPKTPVLLDLSEQDGGLVAFTFPIDATGIDNVMMGDTEYRIVPQGDQVLMQAGFLTPGEYIMTVEQEDTLVSFPIYVASMVIRSAEDLQRATQMADADKGYFVLANNIDCTALTEPISFTDKGVFETGLGQNRAGFLGGFNGMGHTVSDLKVPENGLFGCIAASGVVRNVAFTNIRAKEYAICKDNAGLISQVYVQGDFSRVMFASYSPSNKLENIVAESTRFGAMICQHIASVDTAGYSVSDVHALIMVGEDAKISGYSRTSQFNHLTMDTILRVFAQSKKQSIPTVTPEDGFNGYWDIASGYPIFISSN